MNISHEQLFMPNGKIPDPSWVPKRALYPGSLFEFYSRRLGRKVFLTFLNEFLFALLVEFCPQVKWFAEHYPKVRLFIDNRHVKTTFDMLLRFVSDEFLLVEVKSSTTPLSSRKEEQTMRQRIFAELFHVRYLVIEENTIKANKILIENLKSLRGYLPFCVNETVKSDILKIVKVNQPVKIRYVISIMSDHDPNEVITGIVHHIHDGIISAPIDQTVFGMNSELSYGGMSYDFSGTILQESPVARDQGSC